MGEVWRVRSPLPINGGTSRLSLTYRSTHRYNIILTRSTSVSKTLFGRCNSGVDTQGTGSSFKLGEQMGLDVEGLYLYPLPLGRGPPPQRNVLDFQKSENGTLRFIAMHFMWSSAGLRGLATGCSPMNFFKLCEILHTGRFWNQKIAWRIRRPSRPKIGEQSLTLLPVTTPVDMYIPVHSLATPSRTASTKLTHARPVDVTFWCNTNSSVWWL